MCGGGRPPSGEKDFPRVVTLLMNHAIEQGNSHLFVFTKPKNIAMFSDLWIFSPLSRQSDVLFMENVRDGIGRYVRSLQHHKGQRRRDWCSGDELQSIHQRTSVSGGNSSFPSVSCCTCLSLSEDRSAFPAQVRYGRAGQAGVGHRQRGAAPYLRLPDFSAVFLRPILSRRKTRAEQANCELDCASFCEYFC